MILQWDESFDIGSDTLTGVNDADYKPPFALTAKLNKLTIKIDRPNFRRTTLRNSRSAYESRRRRTNLGRPQFGPTVGRTVGQDERMPPAG